MELPRGTMHDDEIINYVKIPKLKNFIGVFMKDELPRGKPSKSECGILNLQSHTQKGSHWVCWYKDKTDAYYFDSYGEPPDSELKNYLSQCQNTLKRSAVVVQKDQKSTEYGALCLYVLYKLSRGKPFSQVLYQLQKRYSKAETPRLIIKL